MYHYLLSLNIFDPEVPLLGIYAKEIIGQVHRDVTIRMILKHCLQQQEIEGEKN